MSNVAESTDKFLIESLTKILAEVQLRYNLSRPDAFVKVKALVYKVMPMYRKKTIDAVLNELEAKA